LNLNRAEAPEPLVSFDHFDAIAVTGKSNAAETWMAPEQRLAATFSSCSVAAKALPSLDLRKSALLFLLPLLVGCSSNQRFTHVDNQSTYIMFDQKTAQSCWAGPEQNPAEKPRQKPADIPSREFGEGELTPDEANELGLESQGEAATANPPHLPFCKDLK
jgi:hypothetical protein